MSRADRGRDDAWQYGPPAYATLGMDELSLRDGFGWQALKVMRKLNERSVFLRPAHRADGLIAPQGGVASKLNCRRQTFPHRHNVLVLRYGWTPAN